MSEKVLNTIYAGSTPAYEIIQPLDKPSLIIIRSVDDKENSILLFKSMLPILIKMLDAVSKTSK